jgi:hypothetical protein
LTSQGYSVEPPPVAAWLVDLFIPGQQAEPILGDLLEEFSGLVSEFGVAFARRWYWRQSAKTITHFIGTTFRAAPWSITGAVLAGYLALVFSTSLPEQMIVAVLHFFRHHVTPYYVDLKTYVLWLNTSILIGRLLMSLFVGCIVATAAKGKEMLVTMTLALVLGATAGRGILVLLARHWPEYGFLPSFYVDQVGRASMIVMGGVIVREKRLAASRRPSVMVG